jgi:hypothetical protein
MVFLALTPRGLGDAMRISSETGGAVWCAAEAVSESEFAASAPHNVSRFAYELTGENTALLEDALGTIAEHHPGQSIWVEARIA